jgi:hypothetical protein
MKRHTTNANNMSNALLNKEAIKVKQPRKSGKN